MTSPRVWAVGVLTVSLLTALLVAKNQTKVTNSAEQQRRAVHALDRLTFGPRPGDVDRVASMGVDEWIELQLHPEKIDNSAMQARLAEFRTLQMSAKEMALEFPPNLLIKAAMEGKVPIPADPYQHAIYVAGIARLENKQAEKLNSASPASMMAPAAGATLAATSAPQISQTNSVSAQRRPERSDVRGQIDSLILLPPDARMQRILTLPPSEQGMLIKGVPGPKKQALLAGLTPRQREIVIALDNPQGLINYEAQSGKLLRAVYSDRQLEEVLTDFWFNHFNVYIGKGADRYLVTGYERDVIRPHVLGKFKDLLVATAQSSAMLFYLDNWQSEGPNSLAATGLKPTTTRLRHQVPSPFDPLATVRPDPRSPQMGKQPDGANQVQQKRRNGLNENYARELMELHTLGVDGGYTQRDVTEAARVFTGWTLQDPREGGGFVFKERLHEPGTKVVLGHKIKENSEKEGLQVLELLAHQPATAHFISLRLAQRFVSDDPPSELVNQMAKTFLKTDGDLREVMRTMLRSQQFWAPEAYRAKVKTPFEYVVSALRATDTDVTETQPLLNTLNTMGMPVYGMQPPTGYSTRAETWVNSAALLDRMNFSLSLVNNKVGGAHFEAARILPQTTGAGPSGSDVDPYATQVLLEHSLLSGTVSQQTHAAIEQEISSTTGGHSAAHPPTINTTIALLLGSPEFQRR